MAFWLLPNTAGDKATSAGFRSTLGTVATGFDANDAISGPRSQMVRSTALATNMHFVYETTVDVVPTHLVIARADLFLVQNTMALRAIKKNSGGAWDYYAAPNISPFTSASLMGPKLQDYAVAVTTDRYRGFGIEFDPGSATAEAMQFSKMYFSTGFSFDGDLDLTTPPTWQPLPLTQSVNMFIPPLGFDPYEVEATLTLTWLNNTKASIAAFKALPQILNWPLFLYDDSGDVWNWKLEHVLIETWEEISTSKDYSDIAITFKRLKYYE